jgi:hypothetical protein
MNSSIETLELSNFGEPFLNPEIVNIFRVGWQRGVELTIKNGANRNHVKPNTPPFPAGAFIAAAKTPSCRRLGTKASHDRRARGTRMGR